MRSQGICSTVFLGAHRVFSGWSRLALQSFFGFLLDLISSPISGSFSEHTFLSVFMFMKVHVHVWTHACGSHRTHFTVSPWLLGKLSHFPGQVVEHWDPCLCLPNRDHKFTTMTPGFCHMDPGGRMQRLVFARKALYTQWPNPDP